MAKQQTLSLKCELCGEGFVAKEQPAWVVCSSCESDAYYDESCPDGLPETADYMADLAARDD